MKIVADAYRFLIPLLLIAILFAFLRQYGLAAAAAILALFVIFFFRDPEREIPAKDGMIVSPADGKVVRIATGKGNLPLQVSIFLSVFDVHVNRAPIEGRVTRMEHRKGSFKAAFDDAASLENERNIVDIEGGNHSVEVVLIAGLIARRIVSWISPGDRLERGQRIGLIRFGSRVDLFLPRDVELHVKKGDHVRGGASIIGKFT
ncbi:MAG TPA: phosphatidylserine decarboxylase family protein [Acidobacteriota bacterium]|jgi:phosphatidylserine decarboxylase